MGSLMIPWSAQRRLEDGPVQCKLVYQGVGLPANGRSPSCKEMQQRLSTLAITVSRHQVATQFQITIIVHSASSAAADARRRRNRTDTHCYQQPTSSRKDSTSKQLGDDFKAQLLNYPPAKQLKMHWSVMFTAEDLEPLYLL